MFFLSKTRLFYGIKPDEIKTVLTCLQSVEKKFKRKEIIFREGTAIKEIGLVKEGSVNIVEYDYWGNKSILGNITAGDVFGLSYASNPDTQLQGDIVANDDCTVLFLHIEKILTVCSNSCPHHTKLIHNLFAISASKTLAIRQRMKHISGKTIRNRLISYLSEEAFKQKSPQFTVPFNRQQLAEYLEVDRSALSNELAKMQKDGLLVYEKNTFTLKNNIYDGN
ncbi:MAG: Crp/Fnr family transcriptional regulator [Treponema sp.]|jgi:CRP-like cAMP-binding protein|nr:Crp/Fnr family transcriptional regulator [Treponema sp.]